MRAPYCICWSTFTARTHPVLMGYPSLANCPEQQPYCTNKGKSTGRKPGRNFKLWIAGLIGKWEMEIVNRAIYPVGRFWGPVLRSQQPFPQMTLKGLSIFDRSVFQLTSLAWETQKQGHFRTDALKFSFLNRVVDRWNSPPVTSRTIEQ